MIDKKGKLFKYLVSNSVKCIEYDVNQNYYTFIQEKKKDGYCQCIITSDIMIDIIQSFLLQGDIEITSIKFMIDDDELNSEIKSILALMRENFAYWEILKSKLSFLSQKDSIEIKKVSFRVLTGMGALFSVQVNGIIIATENVYKDICHKISCIVEECIR